MTDYKIIQTINGPEDVKKNCLWSSWRNLLRKSEKHCLTG